VKTPKLKTAVTAMNELTLGLCPPAGKVLYAAGPIVELQLDSTAGSSIFSRFASCGESLTLVQQLHDGRVRCVAQSSVCLQPGAGVYCRPEAQLRSFSDDEVVKVVHELGSPSIDKPELADTGIKIVDLMCPIPTRGSMGIFGGQGVGKMALVMELHRRLASHDLDLALFFFIVRRDALLVNQMIAETPEFPQATPGPLRTVWLVSESAMEAHFVQPSGVLDTAILLSGTKARCGQFPAVDPLQSSTRLLDLNIVGTRHFGVATRVAQTLAAAQAIFQDPVLTGYGTLDAGSNAKRRKSDLVNDRLGQLSPADRQLVNKARRLELFFTQPFYCAETFTKLPGNCISREDTICGCEAILRGDVDDWPEEAFYLTGSLADVEKQIGKTADKVTFWK
jgi:hypothetical protein